MKKCRKLLDTIATYSVCLSFSYWGMFFGFLSYDLTAVHAEEIQVISGTVVHKAPALSDAIRDQIISQIDSAGVIFDRVEINVTHGNVSLDGMVYSEEDLNTVGQLASAVPGVESVVNNLEIVVEAEEESESGPRAQLNLNKFNEFGDDATTSANVKRAIDSLNLSSSKEIIVSVEDGLVCLDGDLENFREIDQILAVSLMAEGVRDIDNQIKIDQKPYMSSFPGH